MNADAGNRASRALAEFDRDPDHVLEDVLIDVTEQIAATMEDRGITRKELARRMGVKPPVITRLLNGPDNVTLRTLLRVAFALDMVIDVELGKPEALAQRREAIAEREDSQRGPMADPWREVVTMK